jgi:hypothetical protein
VANVLPKFPSRRVSTRGTITARLEPALGYRLLTLQQAMEPGELLEFEVSIHRVAPELVDRLEVSVLWFTEGKGSEDRGVHFFRSLSHDELLLDFEQPQHLSTKLPKSPLSYDGRLFRIRWCVRLRLFLRDGRSISAEKPFYLGHLTVEI